MSFILPAKYITKSGKGSDGVRKAFDYAFKHCFGRCNWHADTIIICNPDQFVIFLQKCIDLGSGYVVSISDINPQIVKEKDKVYLDLSRPDDEE